MNGAVEHYQACKRHGIKPIVGLEAYFVDDCKTEEVRYERNHLTLLAASDEGFRNLVKLSSAGYLEGYRRGKANVDLPLLERYSEGVIALTGCLQSRFCRRLVDDAAAEARSHVDQLLQVFGAGRRLLRGPEERRAPSRTRPTRASCGSPARSAGRWSPPATSTTCGRDDFDNHKALLCVQTKSTLAEPKLTFDTNEFYLKRLRRDDRRRSRSGPSRSPPRSRSPSAATIEHRARQDADPALRDAGRRARGGLPAPAGPRGAAPALRRPSAGRGRRAARDGAGRDREDGLLGLLPDRLGLRQVRQGQRHRGRPGARLGGGLDRLLLRCRSPTSTRSSTSCCSSASSTPSGSRCRTSTSTSRSRAATA